MYTGNLGCLGEMGMDSFAAHIYTKHGGISQIKHFKNLKQCTSRKMYLLEPLKFWVSGAADCMLHVLQIIEFVHGSMFSEI